MKKQILTLIIGMLIGAIITTMVFLIIKANTGGQGNMMKGQMPSMDTNFQGGENGFTRPEGNNNKRNLNEKIEENDLSLNNIEE